MIDAAGNSASTHGSVFTKLNPGPESALTAPTQIPALTDKATAAGTLSPAGACTAAAVATMLIQQPTNIPSTQPCGTPANATAVAPTARRALLGTHARRGEERERKPKCHTQQRCGENSASHDPIAL